MFRSEIKQKISEVAREKFALAESLEFSVEVPESPEHGDYATNIALVLAKKLQEKPMDIASSLVKELKLKAPKDFLVFAAEPGFINFSIADGRLFSEIKKIISDSDKWGTSNIGKDKTVRVEYFQLNIAKKPHIGHLRSAVIGDSIKRMLLSQGYRAISDTHVGDWGTQFGILLLAYKESGLKLEKVGDTFAELEELYIKENERLEKDPQRREKAKQEFAKLERGDSENRKIWEWMVEISMKKLEASAQRLELLAFNEHRGESFYESQLFAIADLALKKGVAQKTEEGAIVVDLSIEGLDEAVLVKSDGASTYLLRDLATIQYAKKTWDFWQNLYVVDVRQAHHFRQVFRVAELLGFEGTGESRHIEFGFMTSREGALSSRKGTAISLDSVLDEAQKRALTIIEEKNPELKNKEEISQAIGLGALKYFDLSHHRKSDIIFDWEQALSFEGNTGPYLQYTHARLKSILRKADLSSCKSIQAEIGLTSSERHLALSLLRLPEAIEDVLLDFTPNTLANFLYQLAQTANKFYHSHPVLPESDPQKRALRLLLISAAALSLSKGLELLGIEAPEEM